MIKIGIISPTYWEVVRFIRDENLKQLGPTSYSREDEKISIRLEVSGIGANNASRAAELLARFDPEILFCVGFAGSLKPEIRAGDIVLDKDKNDPKILSLIRKFCIQRNLPCSIGQFWNSATPLMKAEQKLNISKGTSSVAVEMEGEAIWKVARAKGIPFCSVRAVSDTLNEDLPLVVTALGYRGNVGWNFWRKFFLSPWDWPNFFRLASNCAKAKRSLADILSDVVADLAPGIQPKTSARRGKFYFEV